MLIKIINDTDEIPWMKKRPPRLDYGPWYSKNPVANKATAPIPSLSTPRNRGIPFQHHHTISRVYRFHTATQHLQLRLSHPGALALCRCLSSPTRLHSSHLIYLLFSPESWIPEVRLFLCWTRLNLVATSSSLVFFLFASVGQVSVRCRGCFAITATCFHVSLGFLRPIVFTLNSFWRAFYCESAGHLRFPEFFLFATFPLLRESEISTWFEIKCSLNRV